MEIKVGQVYRAKSGELMQVDSFIPGAGCQCCMLDPKTKKRTEFSIDGDADKLSGLFNDLGAELIDLESYEPTGLVGT